jgi:hypothetical protein
MKFKSSVLTVGKLNSSNVAIMNKLRVKTMLILIVLSTTAVNGQVESNKSRTTIEFALGTTYLGTGDEWIGKGGIFLKTKFGKSFINEVSFNFGHANRTRGRMSYPPIIWGGEWSYNLETIIMTTFHIDHNLLFSPFSASKKFNIYIGTGYSIMYISDVFRQNVNTYQESTQIEDRSSVGVNFLIEPTYTFKNGNIISIRIISQNYLNADISNGALIKFGRIFQ